MMSMMSGRFTLICGILGTSRIRSSFIGNHLTNGPRARSHEGRTSRILKENRSTDYEPLTAVKQKIAKLDDAAQDWWKPRGEALAQAVHYPVTKSEDEWVESILALDQLVIEGFQEKPLRGLAAKLGRKPESGWRSLKLLEECLLAKDVDEGEVAEAIQALRTVHDLRHLKGHVAATKKAEEAKRALTTYGSFRGHFELLSQGCDEALGRSWKHSGLARDKYPLSRRCNLPLLALCAPVPSLPRDRRRFGGRLRRDGFGLRERASFLPA